MNKLPPKLPQEKISASFDFTDIISSSDYIETVVWGASVLIGVDATPTSILLTPSNSLKVANTLINAGIAGVTYQIDCTVTTHAGLIYVLSKELDILSAADVGRQALVDFALRQLGAPVINIELDSSQIEDAVELAMQQYHEYHFDGLMRDYFVHKITGTTIVVANGANFIVGESIVSTNGNTTATISAISGNTLTINRQIGYEKFLLNQSVKPSNSVTTTTITSITLGDIDHGYLECGENIVGVIKILNISSVLGASNYMFDMQYQIMNKEIQNLTSSGVGSYWQTMNYLGHVDFIMKKEKNFTFNRRTNKLYLEIAWGTDIDVGDVVVAEVYRAVDEHEYPEVYEDIWVRRYVTALLKRQWGTNLSKYTGIQLPGGLTYNGLQIFEQATVDIQKLEDEATFSSAPLEFACG